MANTSVIAVASTANGTYAEGAITITKPSGLVAGNLMVGVFGLAVAETMATPSGWTSLSNSAATWGLSNLEFAAFYKVADSSDAAASNFSFDVSDGTGSLTGTLYRITGFKTTSTFSSVSTANDSATSSSRSHTVSLTPSSSNAILIATMGCQPNSAVTVSSTSSTGSPTWTEIKDETISAGNFWSGWAAYPSVTTITNFSATLNESVNRSDVSIFAIYSQVDSTDTPTFVSSTQSTFATTGTADASATVGFSTSTQSNYAPVGHAQSMPIWTNPDKGTTTWTNPDK